MTPDTSGPASLVPSAYYDPVSSCWKTSGAIFPSDWPTSSETCPLWGMTRGGELFALPTPELPTVEHASSSAPNLPTPNARDGDSRGSQHPAKRQAGGHQVTLNDVAEHVLLPTPAVNDMGEGKTPETWDEWTARMRARHGNGNGHGNSLAIEAQRLLPTPTTQPMTGNGHARHLGGEVRSLGALTNPRFADGSTSSGDQPQPPPGPDETDDPDCLPLWSSG